MDADLALAASYAAGNQPPAGAFAGGQQRQTVSPGYREEAVDAEMLEGELPSVDDLEVAAAAAGVAPVPAVLAELGYFEMGQLPGQQQQGGSSSDESSSSDDEGDSSEASSGESDSEREGEEAGAAGAAGSAAVRLELQLVGDDAVAVTLVPVRAARSSADVDMDAEVAEDSSYASSGSSGSDDEADSGSGAAIDDSSDDEPLDVIENYEDLKKMIADMDAVADVDGDADEDGGGGGAGGSGAHRAESELLGHLPLPDLSALEVKPDDAVQAAGVVQTMLEGMIVIKAQEGSRALSEGCVLVLEDRTPIGVIEEIFGPVMSPLYALRYAGAEPMPASLQQGTTVYSVDRLADFVLPEQLRVRGYDVGLEEEEEEADLEAQFSDDEAEAEHRRKLKAKRKEQPEGLQLGGKAARQGGRGGGGGGGGGGRSGRGSGRGGRGSGRGGRGQQGGSGMGPPAPMQQQQGGGGTPPVMAYYHPHQQQQFAQPPPPLLPSGGRVFSGRLPRQQQPPAGFQAHAAAAQFTGMSLQGMHMQPSPGMYTSGAAYYAGQPLQPPRPSGQVLRPQYAAPQQRPPAVGSVMQAQYAGRPPMQQQPAFTPKLVPMPQYQQQQ